MAMTIEPTIYDHVKAFMDRYRSFDPSTKLSYAGVRAALRDFEAHLSQPAQAVDVPDAIVSMAVEAWNAAPALGREEDDANAMRAAIELALSAMSMPALAVTTALAEKVLSAYATICIDRHHDDAPESARVAAMREALTRALAGEKAEGWRVPDWLGAPLLEWALGQIDEMNDGPLTADQWGEDAAMCQQARDFLKALPPPPTDGEE